MKSWQGRSCRKMVRFPEMEHRAVADKESNHSVEAIAKVLVKHCGGGADAVLRGVLRRLSFRKVRP